MEIKMKSDKKYKVIIWGAGFFCKKLYENISYFWNEVIEVVGVADNNSIVLNQNIEEGISIFINKEMNNLFRHIFSAEEVLALYSEKNIDGVMIGVSDLYASEILRQMEKMQIPCLTYPEFDMISAEELAKEKVLFENSKIGLYILEDVFVGVDELCSKTWIYDVKGRVLSESINYPKFTQQHCRTISFKTDETPDIVKEEVVCVLARQCTKNFWHFTYEALDKIVMLEQIGFTGKYMLFDRAFSRQLIELLHLQEDRFIWIQDEIDVKRYKCKKAYCFESHGSWQSGTENYLYEYVKRVVAENCSEEEKAKYPKRLYVERIGSRRLLDVEELLEKYGFVSMIPDNLTIIEQIKYFHYAEIIICPHGANSSNVMFMQDKKCFIETFGKNYIMPFCLPIIDRKQLQYHMVVEQRWVDTDGTYHLERDADYVLNNELLEMAIKDSIRWIDKKII